jgi:hypothetical protein
LAFGSILEQHMQMQLIHFLFSIIQKSVSIVLPM